MPKMMYEQYPSSEKKFQAFLLSFALQLFRENYPPVYK